MSASAEPTEHARSLCPGVAADLVWDLPDSLRGEIYTEGRLLEHAAELARAHGEPSLRVKPGPLLSRVRAARARIREAYATIAENIRSGRDPSPAQEWLLDNSHVVEDQLREIDEDLPRGYLIKLPRLVAGRMRGYPRVYGLCLDYFRHTDARIDVDSLVAYVSAYQAVHTLTIGELWAVPIMLRLGLLLTIGALAESEALARDRALGDEWADKLLAEAPAPDQVRDRLKALEAERGAKPALMVQLLKRFREHDWLSTAINDWVAAVCSRRGTTPQELVRMHHLRQAADQVSVGNAITSMRVLSALDWNDFFERASAVEAVLRQDPAGAYAAMDIASRDRCRHVVEDVARRSRANECAVATSAVQLATQASDDEPVHRHVGYYLLDAGREALEAAVAYRTPSAQRVLRGLRAHPAPFYLSALALLTASLLALTLGLTGLHGLHALAWVALSLLPLSEIALALLNAGVLALLPPKLLAKLDFTRGIPAECRTLVVVPALLDSPRVVDQLLEALEVRALANADEQLHFALLTDFADASNANEPEDRELLERARQGIAQLNERHAGGDRHLFALLHRRRVWSESEQRFMGWERKRGKLEELNRLLRGRGNTTTFELVSAPGSLLESVRYVITLDADTSLPRDVARKLIGAIAHPLNRPRFEPGGTRVRRGHAILQPRVGTLPLSSRRSRFARICAGPPGIDPYTTAVSDVYQDLFSEGSFVGKGIYDVDGFMRAMNDRVPAERLLSHDLFEGIFARSGLVTDIEVLDEQPDAYEVEAARQHRWLRGDWQLLPWLLPRVPAADGGTRDNDFRILDIWKVLDNLRRSLLAPSLIGFALFAWFSGPIATQVMTLSWLSLLLLPVLTALVLNTFRESTQTTPLSLHAIGGDLRSSVVLAVVNASFWLDHALLSLDAISRALYRMFVSRRGLLEWTTMRQSARQRRSSRLGVARRLWFAAGLALAMLFGVAVADAAALPYALPLLGLWLCAPLLASWLRGGRNSQRPQPLANADRDLFRSVARKTWRFFETFVDDEDNHLPPDNYQQDPRGIAAHRTSPTNIGLYLLSVVAARDFGFIPGRAALERLRKSLDSIERLERVNGHLLNWYDTTSLAPLEPRYVSTVDSGNLAAYLWTLDGACDELASSSIADHSALLAVTDALRLARAAASLEKRSWVRDLDACIAHASQPHEIGGLVGVRTQLSSLRKAILALAQTLRPGQDEIAHWLDAADSCAKSWLEEIDQLAPFVRGLEHSPNAVAASPQQQEVRALELRLCTLTTPAEILKAVPEACAQCEQLEQALSVGGAAAEEREASREYVADLRARLERAHACCRLLLTAASKIGERAAALADGMNFHFLYDEGRKLFSIGYNAGAGRLDPSHYDLLASEARLASLLSVAKGDVPQEHWFRMGRPRTVAASQRLLLSWSGSMFEYLMPLLVTRCPQDTLLRETCEASVQRQIQYGAEQGIAWGISESAYNVMDLSMTYQYRAFGVPGLGLKPGLGDYLVIAPYATALAALLRPHEAAENLRLLSREGLEGDYGYFEAADYTPSHVPPGKKRVVVKAFMAHHQGMSLVAFDEVVNDAPMRRRFHADPRVKATELLLEERVPARAPIVAVRATSISPPALDEALLDATEHVSGGPPRVHLLGHGDVSTLLSSTGSGVLQWRGLDVNRFREDPVFDAGGIYFYLRNLTDHTVWSATLHPTGKVPEFYDAAFSMDRVEFHRRDGAIESALEIVVSPEHPAEIRRLTLTNHGDGPCDLDVTAYTEVVLSPRAADVAHRAFDSLFVEMEALPERGAVLAKRRPRAEGASETFMVQVLAAASEGFGEFDFDCSRASFLGRGNGSDAPQALAQGQKLAQCSGTVLDPAIALRRALHLEPGQRATLTLATALATSREGALELAAVYSASHGIARAFELAWADSRVELKHLAVTATEVHRFQRLLSAVIFPREALRCVHDRAGRGREALWSQGISGDLPIVALCLDDSEFAEICRELLVAQEFLRLNGITLDVLLLNQEPAGYLKPMQEAALDVIRTSPAQGRCDQRGGVFLRRAEQMSEADRVLVLSAARVVLYASRGSLARQLRKAAEQVPELPAPLQPRAAAARSEPAALALPELRFWNGVGGSTPDGREYVMAIGPHSRTPAPWCNVLANPHFGSVIGESGASFTFAGNSQRNRLTPWSNDATADPSGEIIYLRDDDTGQVWSATPRPAGGNAQYLVAHAQGYSRFEHERTGLHCELRVAVAERDPIKLSRLRLSNRSARTRKLSVYAVVEWVLGANRETSRTTVISEWDEATQSLLARNPLSVFPGHFACFGSTGSVHSHSADREEFFGLSGSRERPNALRRVQLSGRSGGELDPCAALQVCVELAAGESIEVGFFLGQAPDRAHALQLAAAYHAHEHLADAYDAAIDSWQQCIERVQVSTPDPAFDLLFNRWLLYQALVCRLWARSGFYQSSGAFGFRDQLQDALALLHARPELAREQLLRAAARQFSEGDVQHWWHPESGEGVRTHCSDDMAWLAFCTAEYVRVTADRAVLDEQIGFLTERALAPNDPDLFTSPASSTDTASLYEHCVRALDVALTAGPHGLPKMRGGDWNDGMNRVGAAGSGESIWLGWFLIKTLRVFLPLVERAADEERARRYRAEIERITQAIEQHGWDGEWYLRAFFDDGTPIGSAANTECRIDSIAQSWSVIAGTGDPERAARAVASAEAKLVQKDAATMLLLTPPFEHAAPDPGYIRSYPAGLRENGGQYTHGVLWTVLALTHLSEGDRAGELLSLLNPIHHGDSPETTARYKIEPYVVAGDVYSAPGHEGRGGWSWYTGAAAWMYRIALEHVIGLRKEGERVHFVPCIPRAWPSVELRYKHAGGELHVHIDNAQSVCSGVLRVEVDALVSVDGSVTLATDGRTQQVRVVLGVKGRAGTGDSRRSGVRASGESGTSRG